VNLNDYNIEAEGKSLQDIVSSIVLGYENKRGLFQIIWDCFFRIFCGSTTLDQLQKLSGEIQSIEALEGYSAICLRQKLEPAIAFLMDLPQKEAIELFKTQGKPEEYGRS
jgi:hypothetical protein